MKELCDGVFCGDSELEPGVFHVCPEYFVTSSTARPDERVDDAEQIDPPLRGVDLIKNLA